AKTRAVLKRVLLDSLALLHPYMPFLSSEIRESLNGDGLRLPVLPFPSARPDWSDPLAVETVDVIRAAATHSRNLTPEPESAQAGGLAAGLGVASGAVFDSLQSQRRLLTYLARLSSLEIAESVTLPNAFRDAIGKVGLVVALPPREISAEERQKLARDLAKI